MSLAERIHLHGWCRACRAHKSSATSACPACGGLLEDLSSHPAHPPVEETVAEVPASGEAAIPWMPFHENVVPEWTL